MSLAVFRLIAVDLEPFWSRDVESRVALVIIAD